MLLVRTGDSMISDRSESSSMGVAGDVPSAALGKAVPASFRRVCREMPMAEGTVVGALAASSILPVNARSESVYSDASKSSKSSNEAGEAIGGS